MLHFLSFFIFKLQNLILKVCRLYNVFGSGSSHGMYAQFLAKSALLDGGRAIGLLRGAGTRFASWFYAMFRALRVKEALLATVHDPKFVALDLVKKNDRVRLAVFDITNEKMWTAFYTVLRAVYPALRALRFMDANTPVMDKLYYLVHRVSEALQLSYSKLNDASLFATLEDDGEVGFELEQVFGASADSDDESEAEEVELNGADTDVDEE